MRLSFCDRFSRCLQQAATVLLLVGLTAGSGSVDAYEIDLVARQFDLVEGQELGFFRGVGLDDQGGVAYTAVTIDVDSREITGSVLMFDDQRVVGTGDAIASGSLGFLGKPSLSGGGILSYSADVFFPGTALSNTGAVVGDLASPAGHQLVVGRDDVVDGVVLEGVINPMVNDNGTFAYTGIYFDPQLGLDASAIIYDGFIVAATGNTVGNFVVDTVDHATLSGQGDLAFAAYLFDLTTQDPLTAIFINGQLAVMNGNLTDGIELTEVFAPAFNRLGDFAYVGRYFDQQANLENTAIILNGQVVLKSGDMTVDGLIIDLIDDVALNAAGQLAFQATFIDPLDNTFFQEGVFLTQIIPEPTSTALLVVMSFVLAVVSFRSKKTAH